MLLAIDVGNTHTVLGIFNGESLVADWRMASLTHRTVDENWLTIKSFCADANIPLAGITGVGISSVVPDLTDVFESLARKYFKVEPVTVTASVTNTGEIPGSHTLILRVKGIADSQKDILLGPGKMENVEFQIIKDTPGFYPVSLENWTGKFVVEMDWNG